MDTIEVKITRWNLAKLLAICSLALSLLGLTVQYFNPSAPGFFACALALIVGGLAYTRTVGQPLRVVRKQLVPVRRSK